MTEPKDPKDIWNELSYDQKLASAMIVFEKIKEHMQEGGTYRYLIYDRLGFNPDAYIGLMDGLYISNGIHELLKMYKESDK